MSITNQCGICGKEKNIDVRDIEFLNSGGLEICDDCWAEMITCAIGRDFSDLDIETLEKIGKSIMKARKIN